MSGREAAHTALLIIGIVVVVIGAGMAMQGYDQMQAADEWGSQVHDCGSVSSWQDPSGIECPDNPYDGWSGKLYGGIVLALIGGVVARFGAKG
jgi:hypothetical protein